MNSPTVQEVDHIAGLAEPVSRNLQITECYFELSARLVQRLGQSANWCTFATWASKQAGQTIRQQDLGQTLKRVVAQPQAMNAVGPMAAPAPAGAAEMREVQQVNETLWDVLDPTAPFDRASAAVAKGNQKVFAEIGRVFAAFIAACLDDAEYDASKIAAFCAELRPGPPPDGQEYLRRAIAGYYDALFATTPKVRAQRLHFANLAIGYHEQTRLQPEIVAALDAPISDPQTLARRLATAVLPYPNWVARPYLFVRRLVGRPLLVERLAEDAVTRARSAAHAIVTDRLMTITFADGAYLRLGHDLRAAFPETLQQIDDPDLAALLALVDPTPDSVHGTGAADWGNLGQRLHFIADMFRCYQETPLLLEAPFTSAQADAIRAGRVPGGVL